LISAYKKCPADKRLLAGGGFYESIGSALAAVNARTQLKRTPVRQRQGAPITERLPRSSLLVMSLASIASVSAAQVRHREHSLGWANGAVTNTALDGRLSQAALQYRSYAPVPRIAFYDIAFPKDCAEFTGMSGHAVLVVTAVVQDSAELPPARIYLASGPGGTELPRIGGVQSRVASADVRATFGQFRVDALYLLSFHPDGGGRDVLMDFAAHRQGFRLAQLSGQVPKPLAACPESDTRSQVPSDSVLWALVRREYPDLSRALVTAH